jgi:hypothetical protein
MMSRGRTGDVERRESQVVAWTVAGQSPFHTSKHRCGGALRLNRSLIHT